MYRSTTQAHDLNYNNGAECSTSLLIMQISVWCQVGDAHESNVQRRGEPGTLWVRFTPPLRLSYRPIANRSAKADGNFALRMRRCVSATSYVTRWKVMVPASVSHTANAARGSLSRGCPTLPGLIM